MDYRLTFEDILPYSVAAPKGYHLPKNFPKCCKTHAHEYEDAQHFMRNFPNCCEAHKEIFRSPSFDPKNFEGVPLELVKKLDYTKYHLCQSIDKANWYDDITDYLKHIILSLGNGSPGGPVYVHHLKGYIDQRKGEMGIHKAQKLIGYLDSLSSVSNDNKTKSFDLNVIQTTYHKWLKLFPFDHPLFKHMKALFTHSLPLFAEEPVYNSYCDSYMGRVITKKELIKQLVQLTQQLIAAIDTSESIRNRYSTDIEEKKWELIQESHRVKQTQLVNEFSEKETKYVKIVKKWLSNEEEFINKITSLPKEIAQSVQKVANPASLSSTETDKKNEFNSMPIPEVRAWFMHLVTTKSKNGKPFLPETGLNQFIERAFQGQIDLPKQRLNYAHGEKLILWNVFYQYYQECISIEAGVERGAQCRDRYIRLLTDNFSNFTFEEVKPNFAKSNQNGRKWKRPN